MRFISRKEAKHRLGDISDSAFGRLQRRGLIPAAVDLPGRPLPEEAFEQALQDLAKREPPRDRRNDRRKA